MCAGVGALLLAGCYPAGSPEPGPLPSASAPADGPTTPASPASPDTAGDRVAAPASGPVTADVTVAASGLPAPWALATLPDGRFLVTLCDEARVVVVDPDDGSVTPVGGAGAEQLRDETEPAGEGGLLGVAVAPGAADGPIDVFLYRTGDDDNAVVRAELTLDGPALGELTTVLDGIPRAGNHNGGRLKVGPDGFLYVTTGDAAERSRSQDPDGLGGKILRITPDGEPAPGNPVAGSPVWSLGHRNVQGIAWDAAGNLLASEFGQNTWDELNQVVPGSNYGWPVVEGADDVGQGEPVLGPAVVDGFTRPLTIWRTSDASPSGLAVTDDAAYLASLRGQRLWRVPLETAGDVVRVGPAQVLLDGEGRLRDVVADADGSLWVLTNNTDGRGSPRRDDDRLLHVVVSPG